MISSSLEGGRKGEREKEREREREREREIHVHLSCKHNHTLRNLFLLDFGVNCIEKLRRKVLSIISLSLIPNEFLYAYKIPFGKGHQRYMYS